MGGTLITVGDIANEGHDELLARVGNTVVSTWDECVIVRSDY